MAKGPVLGHYERIGAKIGHPRHLYGQAEGAMQGMYTLCTLETRDKGG